MIARNITTQLQSVLSSMKEQTLINGRLAAGWRFEDAVNLQFIAEKRRNLQRFSVLKEVVIGDIHTLTNENIRMMHSMKLLPCILLALVLLIFILFFNFMKLFFIYLFFNVCFVVVLSLRHLRLCERAVNSLSCFVAATV